MKTFYISNVNSNVIQLTGDEHNHLKNVMRLCVGDNVKVDCGGYAICWDDEIDISEVELWDNGIEL